MKKKEFTPEQIIIMLREAEVLLSQGTTAVKFPGSSASPSKPTTAGEENTEACVSSRPSA